MSGRVVGYVVEHDDGSRTVESMPPARVAVPANVRADLYAVFGLLAGEIERHNREVREERLAKFRATRARREAS